MGVAEPPPGAGQADKLGKNIAERSPVCSNKTRMFSQASHIFPQWRQVSPPLSGPIEPPHRTARASRQGHSYANCALLYRVIVTVRQQCADSFRHCITP